MFFQAETIWHDKHFKDGTISSKDPWTPSLRYAFKHLRNLFCISSEVVNRFSFEGDLIFSMARIHWKTVDMVSDGEMDFLLSDLN